MNFFNLRITGTAKKKDLDIYGSHLGISTWLSQRLFCSFSGKELFNFESNIIYPTLFREEVFMITLISIHLCLLRLYWPKFLTLFHLIFARFQKPCLLSFFQKIEKIANCKLLGVLQETSFVSKKMVCYVHWILVNKAFQCGNI